MLVGALAVLVGSASVQGAVTLTPDASYPASPKVFTADPETLTPSGRGVTGTRQLRQTFQLSESIDVDGIVLSFAGSGTDGGLVISFYEVADVNASTWSAGTLVKTISLGTGVDLPSSSARLGLSLSGTDIFTLPQRDTGTSGYGIEISNADGVSTVGSIRHSNNGVDNYTSGKFYIESGSHSGTGNRDIGLALTGTANTNSPPPPPPTATWYVAPNGNDSNPGTLASPFASITRAQEAANPGDTVYLRGGMYTSFAIAASDSVRDYYHYIYKSGISYLAYPGDSRPVFDLSSVSPNGLRICAFGVFGHTNTFEGFDVTGIQAGNHSQVDCWRIRGNGNTLRLIVNRDAQAYGVYIFGSASDTLVENCDSYNLIGVQNSSASNTDGFGCHSAGSGNVFRGCRAWACSDDGYDSLNNDGGSILFDHCWAYDNGRHDGNKVGFKIGGYGCSGDAYPSPAPVHEVRFCLAARNGSSEFYANHHPGQCANWYNNTAYDLSSSGFNMLEGNNNSSQCSVAGWREVMHNNLTHVAGIANLDLNQSVVNNNSWTLPVTVTDADFVSLDASQMTLPRKADGSLPDITFMQLVSGSDLIDRGVNVGLPYSGSAPDLGCFESDGSSPPPPPSAPTGLGATAVSSSQIDLLWNASSGATSYNVKRDNSSGGPYTTVATGVTATSFSDVGLSASTTYYYVVSALNTGGESANSTEASATTQASADTTPPAAPTGLAATAGNNSVALDWADNTEPDLASYNVKRSTTSGGPYTILATGVAASAYTDNTAANGTTYYYVVSAVDTSSNESANSSQASATPSAPSGSTMHVANIQVDRVNAGGGQSRAEAVVTIVDNNGNPVSNATVTVAFTGAIVETKSGVTGGNGIVTITTSGTAGNPAKTTGCVDNVIHSSLTYDSGANVVTCDNSW